MALEDVLVNKRKIWAYVLKGLLTINVVWEIANLVAVLISINNGPGKPLV